VPVVSRLRDLVGFDAQRGEVGGAGLGGGLPGLGSSMARGRTLVGNSGRLWARPHLARVPLAMLDAGP